MVISEKTIEDQRRAFVSKGLIIKPWLEEIRAQVVENLNEANVNSDEETMQHTDENQQKENGRRL